jgi:drug/metabolite transporter (DMT)-like permease
MTRIFLFVLLALFAFAGNSLLCRIALRDSTIDFASFTSIRLVSGALFLVLLIRFRYRSKKVQGNWFSGLALFAYAAGFSFAYLQLSAATGALLLFAAVQLTMLIHAVRRGERLRTLTIIGFVLAVAGVLVLLLPGLSRPPLGSASVMVLAGIAWGIYSIHGQSSENPILETTGNFLRAATLSLIVSILLAHQFQVNYAGVLYAVMSGAICSGIGYSIWYSVLPSIKGSTAAVLQLSVPVIASFGGIIFLNETINLRFAVASILVLGGITLVVIQKSARE